MRHSFQRSMLRITTLFLLVLLPTISFAQSRLSQELQQKLRSRKASSDTQKKSKDTTSNDTSSPPVVKLDTSNVSKPLSPQAYTESVSIAIASKNLSAFNALVSWPTIASKATKSLSGKAIDEFRTEFLKEIQTNNSLGAKIIATVNNGGTYEFLELKKSSSTVVAIFRMILPGGRGVNYHEYQLAKTKDKNVIAADIYVYLAGETLSKSVRRNLITAMAENGDASKVNLSGTDKLMAENVSIIKDLTKALSEGNAEGARSLLLKLPAEVRADKALQTLTLNTYRKSSAFATVVEQVRKSNPDDVFMEMLAIDAFASQKKYDEAIKAINKVSTRVGGDPYLMVLKGRMELKKGNEKVGRKLITDAIESDDSLLNGYWNLVSFSLKDKKHEETLRLLKKIDSKFKVNFRDLRDIPTYTEFVKSSQFAEWSKYREANTAPSESLNDVSGKSSRKKEIR